MKTYNPVGRQTTQEDVTRIEEIEINVSPNPVVNGIVHISATGDNEPMHVNVLDNTGRLLHQKSGESQGMMIDISGV